MISKFLIAAFMNGDSAHMEFIEVNQTDGLSLGAAR